MFPALSNLPSGRVLLAACNNTIDQIDAVGLPGSGPQLRHEQSNESASCRSDSGTTPVVIAPFRSVAVAWKDL
jgi:hypothetical protein